MPITKEQIENDFNTYKYTNPAICTPQQIKLSEYIRECQRLMEENQKLREALEHSNSLIDCIKESCNEDFRKESEAQIVENNAALTPASDGKEAR